MSSKIPPSSFSRTTSPHSRSNSQDSLANGSIDLEGSRPRLHRVASRNIPRLDSGAVAASPLSRVGIKGDGLMLVVTCFASLGVFLEWSLERILWVQLSAAGILARLTFFLNYHSSYCHRQFGYDQGVMSGIITGPYFKEYFNNPTPYEIGTMVAILEVGAFITSLLCGTLADTLGRKKTLLFGAIIFSLGGAIQTVTIGYRSMVVGRVVAGLGVGFLSMIVPTYQSECSAAEHRGRLACIEFTINIVGYCSSIWLDWLFSFYPSDLSWRLPLSFQVIIGLILATGSLLLPESPRWLLDNDRDEEGMMVLADLHGGGDPRSSKARLEYREIKENVLSIRGQDRSYSAMWKECKYRVLIACSSQMFAQLNGINVVSYYAPLIFESAGWVGRDAILMTGLNGLVYVAASVIPWFLIDRLGRRVMLLGGSLGCGFFLALTGYFLFLDSSLTPTAVVACVILFNAVFATGWGPIPWLFPPEILGLRFRAKGTSASTATNWLFNFIVGEITPVLQQSIKWRLYPMHAFLCLISFVVVYVSYPETAGVPLEEMDALFGDVGSSVPQGDSEDEEDEGEGQAAPSRPVRTSISSHPRFQSDDERAARAAAAQVAAENRAKWTLNPRDWLARMTGSGIDHPDRRLYESIAGNE